MLPKSINDFEFEILSDTQSQFYFTFLQQHAACLQKMKTNNVVGYFVQLEQILTNSGYSYDDIIIVACPTPEQVSVFISSASLISHNETVLPYGKKRPTSVIRKPSVTSIEEKSDKPTTDISSQNQQI